LGQLSSPTISSQSTGGASTAHQPSPGDGGDGDTSEASDSAHQQMVMLKQILELLNSGI